MRTGGQGVREEEEVEEEDVNERKGKSRRGGKEERRSFLLLEKEFNPAERSFPSLLFPDCLPGACVGSEVRGEN